MVIPIIIYIMITIIASILLSHFVYFNDEDLFLIGLLSLFWFIVLPILLIGKIGQVIAEYIF